MCKQLWLLGLLAGCAIEPIGRNEQAATVEWPSNNGFANWDAGTGIVYQGGDILAGDGNIYLIFVEAPPVSDNRVNIFYNFLTGLSGSPLANVLTTFTDAAHARPSGKFTVHSVVLTGTRPRKLVLDDVINQANAQLAFAHVPIDPHAIYVVVGDQNTTLSWNGFDHCNTNCAEHGTETIGRNTYNVAWIGDPQYCVVHADTLTDNKCRLEDIPVDTPHGKALDRMANSMWHEVAETITDFNGGGYQREAGDLCEGYTDGQRIGTGYSQVDLDYSLNAGPSFVANIRLGSDDYRLQPIWQNAASGGCVRGLLLNRPALSISPYLNPTGDFNADGAADLLFRDSGDGMVWLQSAGSTVLVQLAAPPKNDQIVGLADFDSDGRTDILWRDLDTGSLILWLVKSPGSPIYQKLTLVGPNLLSMDWEVKGVGDFDAQAGADILFENAITREILVWYNSPAHTFSVNAGAPAPSVHTAFQVAGQFDSEHLELVGTGELDGYPGADMIWRDVSLPPYYYTYFTATPSSPNLTPIPPKADPLPPHPAEDNLGLVLGLAAINADHKAKLIVRGSLNPWAIYWVEPSDGTMHPIRNPNQSDPPPPLRYSGSSMVGNLTTGFSPALFWRDRRTGEVVRWTIQSDSMSYTSTVIGPTKPLNLELAAY